MKTFRQFLAETITKAELYTVEDYADKLLAKYNIEYIYSNRLKKRIFVVTAKTVMRKDDFNTSNK